MLNIALLMNTTSKVYNVNKILQQKKFTIQQENITMVMRKKEVIFIQSRSAILNTNMKNSQNDFKIQKTYYTVIIDKCESKE